MIPEVVITACKLIGLDPNKLRSYKVYDNEVALIDENFAKRVLAISKITTKPPTTTALQPAPGKNTAQLTTSKRGKKV